MTLRRPLTSLGYEGGVEIDTTPVRFDYTGSVQTYTVPAGVKKLSIDCVGAGRKASIGGYESIMLGGRVECLLSVSPNDVLYVYVGGSDSFNGGGKGSSSSLYGCGSSDVRTVQASLNSWYDTSHSSWDSDSSLLSRKVCAGGAGGGSRTSDTDLVSGTRGGGLIGEGKKTYFPKNDGAGGTQSSGGEAGINNTYGSGFAGGFGYGGNCAKTRQDTNTGLAGGGGGGWFGGGGGSDGEWGFGGQGGGGSSYTDPNLCTDVIHTQGYSEANGNGWIIINPVKG